MNKWLIATVIFLILASAIPVAGAMKLDVKSPVFSNGERIPVKYTCDGEDVSPPLAWTTGPAATQSYAMIVDDPDAPGAFTHWSIYDISASVTRLDEHAAGYRQGLNDFGKTGYGGPCPPAGKPHNYRFHVYALDSKLDLKSGASKGDVLNAIKGHVLAEGELVGTYGR